MYSDRIRTFCPSPIRYPRTKNLSDRISENYPRTLSRTIFSKTKLEIPNFDDEKLPVPPNLLRNMRQGARKSS